MTEAEKEIRAALEAGFWQGRVYDCRPSRHRSENPLKHARTMLVSGVFASRDEAMQAAETSIRYGWAGNTMIHRETAKATASFELSRDDAGRLAENIPALLAELTSLREERDALIVRLMDFVAKAQGTAMGVAMSGRSHPDPDGALMGIFNDGQEIVDDVIRRRARALIQETSE